MNRSACTRQGLPRTADLGLERPILRAWRGAPEPELCGKHHRLLAKNFAREWIVPAAPDAPRVPPHSSHPAEKRVACGASGVMTRKGPVEYGSEGLARVSGKMRASDEIELKIFPRAIRCHHLRQTFPRHRSVKQIVGGGPFRHRMRAEPCTREHRSGSLLANLSGGLISRGYPIGTTGVSHHRGAAMQRCGEAGEMPLPCASLAGRFTRGGTAFTNDVSILECLL